MDVLCRLLVLFCCLFGLLVCFVFFFFLIRLFCGCLLNSVALRLDTGGLLIFSLVI